jgi:hypothetical protein
MCPNDGMEETDLDTASNQCDEGYYCGAGIDAVSVTKQQCDIGRYCPANSMEQLPCDSGYYQDTAGMGTCNECEEGSYCGYSTALVSQKQDCPTGHSCLTDILDAPVPCAEGTYRSGASSAASDQCLPCTAGYYCPYEGMDTPIACPQYMFCVEGSIIPEACIDGQLCDTAVPISQTVKTDCTNGYYCIKGFR